MVIWIEVVPPRRSLIAAPAPFRVSVPPAPRLVVTKPSLPVAWSRITASPRTVSVPRSAPELSPVRVQSPVPILVTLSWPVV